MTGRAAAWRLGICLCMFLRFATGTTAAWGVVIRAGDGTGAVAPPFDDPGWGNVGSIGNATGIYLGNGWVLTAAHVWGNGQSAVCLNGTYYPVQPGSPAGLFSRRTAVRRTSRCFALPKHRPNCLPWPSVPALLRRERRSSALATAGAVRLRRHGGTATGNRLCPAPLGPTTACLGDEQRKTLGPEPTLAGQHTGRRRIRRHLHVADDL